MQDKNLITHDRNLVEIKTGYTPQPKQLLLHQSTATEILYGGAAGPGKSHAIRHDLFDWACRIPGLQVYLFRRTFPELEKNHIIKALAEFPKEVCKWRENKKRFEFYNGSMFHFCNCEHEKDVFDYLSAEINVLGIDELTTFSEFQYDFLRARVRKSDAVPPQYKDLIPRIVCGSNPGNIGHEFVKRRWVKFAQPYEIKRATDAEGGMLRQFIPGLLKDNRYLMEHDPDYWKRLNALPEPYRTAYLTGDWDIFIGQAFLFNYEEHTVKDFPVPPQIPIYMTYDWGFGKPFSIGWWWIDSDGRKYRFAEWYGWNGTPDQGVRLADSSVAQEIVRREKEFTDSGLCNMNDRFIDRIAGHDCFSQKPNYMGGGQGKSTSEVFLDYGLRLRPGDPDRKLKYRQFHEHMKIPEPIPDMPRVAPMVQIYRSCEQWIRTIPLLQTEPRLVEDVNTKNEDHSYDETAHIFMARPINWNPDAPAEKERKKPLIEEAVAIELEEIRRTLSDDLFLDEMTALG